MPQMIGKNKFYRASDFKNIKESTEEIKGLHCPDCNAQAYRTDHPGIAVCGDYPGWYFLYEHDEQKGKKKFKLVIKGGQYIKVPVFKTQTITNHP